MSDVHMVFSNISSCDKSVTSSLCCTTFDWLSVKIHTHFYRWLPMDFWGKKRCFRICFFWNLWGWRDRIAFFSESFYLILIIIRHYWGREVVGSCSFSSVHQKERDARFETKSFLLAYFSVIFSSCLRWHFYWGCFSYFSFFWCSWIIHHLWD